jgi:hypothetical protein
VIGTLGGDKMVADAADPDRRAVQQRLAKRRHDLKRGEITEQPLDVRPEGARQGDRSVDRRRIATGLHGGHQLATHARARGELGLSEPGFKPLVA